eukprot:scaffold61046_cov44-Phaeocystis_antarctica.AAC.1
MVPPPTTLSIYLRRSCAAPRAEALAPLASTAALEAAAVGVGVRVRVRVRVIIRARVTWAASSASSSASARSSFGHRISAFTSPSPTPPSPPAIVRRTAPPPPPWQSGPGLSAYYRATLAQ